MRVVRGFADLLLAFDLESEPAEESSAMERTGVNFPPRKYGKRGAAGWSGDRTHQLVREPGDLVAKKVEAAVVGEDKVGPFDLLSQGKLSGNPL